MNQSTQALLGDPAFARLKQHVIEATGLAYYQAKDDDLAGPLAARLAVVGLPDCHAYRELLQSGPEGDAELDLLVAELTIGETSFFRHREQFEALKEIVFPDLLRRNQPSRRLRLWSAGCATGAEPYSLAILLAHECGRLLEGWEVTILGTDINRSYLAAAQRGEFSDWTLRSAPEDLKLACFSRTGNQWTLQPQYRQWVTFQYHNLVQHAFPSLLHNLFAFDVILCRNVMIYFSPEIIARSLAQFHEALGDGGWLLVGHAESNVELFRAFETINFPGAVLYRKNNESAKQKPAGTSSAVYSRPTPTPVVLKAKTALQHGVTARTTPSVIPNPATPPVPEVSTWQELRAMMDAGQWDQALQSCLPSIERNPLDPLGHYYQALLLERTAAHAAAEQALKRAIYLDRSFVLAHYCLAQLERRRGDERAARRSFNNVLKLLAALPRQLSFAEADGLTADDLVKLTQMHIELLEER